MSTATYPDSLAGDIPNCYNRATGRLIDPRTDSLYGTPAVDDNIFNTTSDGTTTGTGTDNWISLFEEASDSPVVEVGEQTTIQHTYFVDYLTGIFAQTDYPRGQVMYDNTSGPFGPNVSRVLSTTLQPIARTGAQICKLNVVSECMTFAAPPEEFDIEVVELNPPAEKHPRYSGLTYIQRDNIRNQTVADSADVAQQWLNSVTSSCITTNPSISYPSALNQYQQGLELMYKKQKGEDNFYLSGYKMIFSQYFWQPVDINPGGYIENPFLVVPAYYWTDQNDNNIFSKTTQYNPNVYINNNNNPNVYAATYGLSWLRQTDVLHQQRTWYKLTSTWVAGTLGMWDNEWYNGSFFQPYQTTGSAGSIFSSGY